MIRVSISKIRKSIGYFTRKISEPERVIITKNGKEIAVTLSIEEYDRLMRIIYLVKEEMKKQKTHVHNVHIPQSQQ